MPRPLGESTNAAGAYVETTAVNLEPGLEQQSFDNYLSRAASQPSDSEAFESLRSMMASAMESGQTDFVMRNAMLLAATACTDPHLEELANEAGSLVDNLRNHSPNDGHGHGADHSEALGSTGPDGKKSKKKTASRIRDLIFNYKRPGKVKLIALWG